MTRIGREILDGFGQGVPEKELALALAGEAEYTMPRAGTRYAGSAGPRPGRMNLKRNLMLKEE